MAHALGDGAVDQPVPSCALGTFGQESHMKHAAAQAAIFTLLLSTALSGGCSSCGSAWGPPPAAYPSGYGPATGAVGASTAPPANYGEVPPTDPGWRAAPGAGLPPGGGANVVTP